METKSSLLSNSECKNSIMYTVYRFIKNQVSLGNLEDLNSIYFNQKKQENDYFCNTYKFYVNQLLLLLKKENSCLYRQFREIVGINDSSLEPGDFYDKMYIEMSFSTMSLPPMFTSSIDKESEDNTDNFFNYTIDWLILFEDPDGEELIEFELSNTMYNTNISRELYLYDNFMRLVENECNSDTIIKKCYDKYREDLIKKYKVNK